MVLNGERGPRYHDTGGSDPYGGFLGRLTHDDGATGVFRLVALASDRVVRVEALPASTAAADTPPLEAGSG